MRALITGGAGFIGSHLAQHLILAGADVVVLDDLSTGSIANIASLRGHAGFEYHIDSVFNAPLVAELVDSCDVVFHLAAAVGVRLIVESPVRTLDLNVRATELLLKIASKKKKPVLIASTSEVYGKSAKIPFHEDDDLVLGPTVRGRWSYACSKAVDEFLAFGYYNERGLPVVVARLFNTVGPRQSGAYGMVVPRFVEQALAGKPITVYGTGDQSRCFSWVGDVVDALAKLIVSPTAVGRVFNVGSAHEITIRDLANLVRERTGSASPVQFQPYDAVYGSGFEDMFRRVPDLTRIREEIEFRPTKSLTEILDAVIDDVRERKNGHRTRSYVAATAD